jgi:hypothetical protein
MDYQILIFNRIHEKEQGINHVLESINLANLDDELEPTRYLTC